jgi:methylglutaconyl-CoA hydratase
MTRSYETIRVDSDQAILTVWLHRPEVRNAFNEVVIAELTEVFGTPPAATRAIVLRGEGAAFCAGADINWMKRSASFTEAENARDAGTMRAMFRAIDECPCPVIGRVHGVALGGGMGLVAACDIVVAADDTKFGFTEARLGIVPAVISPFALRKIGVPHARRYFLTGEIFGAAVAHAIGLVHEVVTAGQLDEVVDPITKAILQCGPNAVGTAKKLIREVAAMGLDNAGDFTVATIAKTRVSAEGQEGLGAFLEKRKPGWG